MPISENLLEILCCPVTKIGLKILSEDQIANLNQLINDGKIQNETLDYGLITIDQKIVYRITDGIPNMNPNDGISVANYENFVSHAEVSVSATSR